MDTHNPGLTTRTADLSTQLAEAAEKRSDAARMQLFPKAAESLDAKAAKLELAQADLDEARPRQLALTREWEAHLQTFDTLKQRIDSAGDVLSKHRAGLAGLRAQLAEEIGTATGRTMLTADSIATAEQGLSVFVAALNNIREQLPAVVKDIRAFGKANGIPEEVWPSAIE